MKNLLILGASLLFQSAIWAQTRPVFEVPRAILTPKINAAPLDAAWASAAKISALSPSIGAKGHALPTQIRALWDEDFLYFRFECKDSEIYAPFGKSDRDQSLYQGDCVEIFLDVVGDGKQVFEFQFSPKNQVFDQNITLTTEPRADENFKLLPEVLKRDFWLDASWNAATLKSAASQNKSGWIVDVALPAKAILKRLGEEKFAPQTLRANLLRYDYGLGAKRELLPMNWAPVLDGCPHISPGAMGFLKLMGAK